MKWFFEQLNRIDPMPWHQAVLLALGLFTILVMALIAPNGPV